MLGGNPPGPAEMAEGALIAANILLNLCPKAPASQPFNLCTGSIVGHPPATAEFDMVAPRKTELARMLILIEPPGHIQLMAARRIFIERRQALEQWNLPAQAAAYRVHQVAPYLAVGVREAIGKRRALRIEQNSDRLAGARGKYHGPGGNVLVRTGSPVNQPHPACPAFKSQRQLVNHHIGAYIQISTPERRRRLHT